MSETTMPAAEAEAVVERDDERANYELAFHVLPTVAEGEVPKVFAEIKDHVTSLGGEHQTEEAAERVDLAYEIVKPLEGKNRKFSSAYFGWIRFSAEPAKVGALTEWLESNTQILRHLLIRLTKVEEETVFRFHEVMKGQKMVSTVEDSEVVPDFSTVTNDDSEENIEEEEEGEVDEKELDEALEKKEV